MSENPKKMSRMQCCELILSKSVLTGISNVWRHVAFHLQNYINPFDLGEISVKITVTVLGFDSAPTEVNGSLSMDFSGS